MKIPPVIYYISAFFSVIALYRGFFLEVGTSFILLIFIFRLFWVENTPPIIITGLFFQWLSISIGYIYLSVSKYKMVDLLWRPDFSLEKINLSFWLSLFGLLFFALGVKLGIKNIKVKNIPSSLIQNYSVSKIIVFYIFYTFFSDLLFKIIRFSVPGLAQPINMLSFFKWSLLFLLIYISVKKKEKRFFVFFILVFEIIIGFTGYFSAFKDILIMIALVWLTFNKIKGAKQLIIISAFAFLLFNIGAVWSYVKVDYRAFLSGGDRSQIVTVGKQEALGKLVELSSNVNYETYKTGIKNLVKRIFFLEYFSATINNIPKNKPFFNGEIWSAAVEHITKPRFLFPGKKIIDDSEQTMRLTSIRLAGSEQGTSISAGYMAESYADFGQIVMMIPVFFLGFIIGTLYRFFIEKIKNPIWSYSFVFPLYFLININGKNIIKIAGNLFWFFIVFFIIVLFFLPMIDNLIKDKK